MSVGVCPMCKTSQLAVVDENVIAGSIYIRQALTCSDLACTYSWWGRKPTGDEITDEMAAEVAH